MEIQEQVISSFADEPEAVNFLTREHVQAVGGITVDVRQFVKIEKKTKNNEPYTVYRIYIVKDNYEYVVDNVFRNQMKWKKDTPKKVHISTEAMQKGEQTFQNWVIKPA